jgi:hypothetical protein
MTKRPILLFLTVHALGILGAGALTVLNASDFEIHADGTTDDGPVIRKMLARAATIDDEVVLAFPRNKVIAVNSGTDRYAFKIHGQKDLIIDGGGSEFRLDPHLRFLDAFNCERLEFRDLKIDYQIQPTAPGTIIAVDAANHIIDVRLDWPQYAPMLGGPTQQDGEQAFFGMILMDALYGMTKVSHFYVNGAEALGGGRVRIASREKDVRGLEEKITLGKTRICLPVPGVAHRYGPGALIRIDHCKDVTGLRTEVWSAPWFAFQIFRNSGTVTMQEVHVRPRPGGSKVLSACRDAFHAKGNWAKLIFDGCILTGLGDDAFNLSTHASRVRKVVSPTELEVSQHFPIQYMPMRVGDTLVVMDPGTNEVVGESRIAAIEEIHHGDHASTFENQFKGRAPTLRLTLSSVILGLQPGLVAWDREASNPDTIVRKCTIRRSCRFQTNVTLDSCDVETFLWFYGASVEGPGPESVTIENSILRSASVEKKLGMAVSISGWEGSKVPDHYPPQPATALLKQVRIAYNEVWGTLRIRKALAVEIIDNRYPSAEGEQVDVQACGEVKK